MTTEKQKGKALIVGGSIAGISCAHALISAGWEVVVLEKSGAPPKGCPTGAGLSVDPLSQHIIQTWIHHPHLLHHLTLPHTIVLEQAVVDDGEKKGSRLLHRKDINCGCGHWSDLHDLLHSSLPPEIFLWGHFYLSLSIPEDKTCVKVKAKVVQTGEVIEIIGDLLVAADGCLSSIRRAFLPDVELRYSGYCAWRGVLDYGGNEDSEMMVALRRAYPELGKCIYFDRILGAHAALFEVPRKRLNWLWYVQKPEPERKGNSVTMKVSSEMIKEMLQEADKVFPPELASVMKETKEPFLNFIYDCDPLEKIYWDKVVLVGDAAHPTTPHCARSTNMSIEDAAVLGKCLDKYGVENLASALEEYQSIRQPITSKQVLFSRRVGRIKQGLSLPDRSPFDPMTTNPEEYGREFDPHT